MQIRVCDQCKVSLDEMQYLKVSVESYQKSNGTEYRVKRRAGRPLDFCGQKCISKYFDKEETANT